MNYEGTSLKVASGTLEISIGPKTWSAGQGSILGGQSDPLRELRARYRLPV